MRKTTRTAGIVLAVAMSALAAAGCKPLNTDNGAREQPRDAGQTRAASGVTAPVPPPGTCTMGHRLGQDLPDPRCTPGSLNPQVTQATIADTICKTGWTKTVRPPVSVTNKLKHQLAESYGLGPDVKGELDHLISLELGGALADPANLWLEPGPIPNKKDPVENKLHGAVCAGLVPLAAAQKAIATDWTTAFDAVGLRVAGGKVCLRADPSRCIGDRRGDEDGN
jgi:hypothetical protein